MLALSRRTYTWLTTGLLFLSAILFFGSIVALQTDWLRRADFLVQFAVFPGGLIAGGVVFLINGCVEDYADILPPKFRARRSTRSEWDAIFDPEQMLVVESILKRFARSHGFRTTDAFQFRPQDRLEELIQEFYPGCSDAEDLLRKSDLTRRVHSRMMTMAVWLQTAVLWSFVSPLILLFQSFPEKEMHTRIRQGTA